jgi:hypothetical protein
VGLPGGVTEAGRVVSEKKLTETLEQAETDGAMQMKKEEFFRSV